MGNCYFNNEKNYKFSKEVKESVRRTSYNPQELKLINFKTNKEILDRYKIITIIGSGLFSKVYLVVDEKGEQKALKVIKKKNFTAPKVLEKFLIEKEILKNSKHPNILRLFKTMQSSDRIYYELEFASQGNLLQLLNSDVQFSIDDIKTISAQIIFALFHLHDQNILYGDLKAENILLNHRGIIKLCDFNLSGTASLLCNSFQGTLNYVSPELIDKKGITKKSDFWSLGVLVFLLYFRQYPFSNNKNNNRTETIFNIRNRIFDPCFNEGPSIIKKFILDLLNVNPEQRLGDSLEDFFLHPFFLNFNWEEVKKKNAYFTYNIKFDGSSNVKSGKSSFQDSNINFDLESRPPYFIDGFSFVNSENTDNNSGIR